jgi:hypothetical protein
MWKPTQIYMFILHALYKTIKVNEMGDSIQLPWDSNVFIQDTEAGLHHFPEQILSCHR